MSMANISIEGNLYRWSSGLNAGISQTSTCRSGFVLRLDGNPMNATLKSMKKGRIEMK